MNFNFGMILLSEYVKMLVLNLAFQLQQNVGGDTDQMLRMTGQHRTTRAP